MDDDRLQKHLVGLPIREGSDDHVGAVLHDLRRLEAHERRRGGNRLRSDVRAEVVLEGQAEVQRMRKQSNREGRPRNHVGRLNPEDLARQEKSGGRCRIAIVGIRLRQHE